MIVLFGLSFMAYFLFFYADIFSIVKYSIFSLSVSAIPLRSAAASLIKANVALSSSIEALVSWVEAAFCCEIAESSSMISEKLTLSSLRR